MHQIEENENFSAISAEVKGAIPTDTHKSDLAGDLLDATEMNQKEVLIGGDTDDNRFD